MPYFQMAYATRTLNVNTEIYNPEYCTKVSGNCIILNYESAPPPVTFHEPEKIKLTCAPNRIRS